MTISSHSNYLLATSKDFPKDSLFSHFIFYNAHYIVFQILKLSTFWNDQSWYMLSYLLAFPDYFGYYVLPACHLFFLLFLTIFSNSLSFLLLFILSHQLPEQSFNGWCPNWPFPLGLHLLYTLWYIMKVYGEYHSLKTKSVIDCLLIPKNQILLLNSLSD